MQIIRRDAYKKTPWKNGSGVTEEIIVWPSDADIVSFDWRVSIAYVGEDGPFSIFEGIDRTIALIEGAGLHLNLPDGRTERLTRSSEPFAFPGEWPIAGRNAAGPTTDLNVMSRRNSFKHTLRRRQPGRCSFPRDASHWLLLPTSDTTLRAGQSLLELRAFDTAMIAAADQEAHVVDVSVSFFEVALHPAGE